jgi:ribose transport system ATP-binding protein
MSQLPVVLKMKCIGKRFGATHALRDVELEAHSGEVLALIGENGAGKSTLMKILSGAHPADSGHMTLAGRPYAPTGVHHARLAGVAMIYQELNLAPDLSVEDNILLGQERRRFGLLDRRTGGRIACEVLTKLGHEHLDPKTIVGTLSVGMQQVVEIARALASDAKVLILDEPTSSLAHRDVDRLFDVIRALRSDGLAIIYISHFLEEIRQICDRYTVLRDGRTMATGLIRETSDAQIISLMVGREVDALFPQVPHQIGETIVHVENLNGRRFPIGATFQLRRGEILGITGLVGAGRTELMRALFGLDNARSGRVRIGGVQMKESPRARIRAGMGMVSEDRKGEGLALPRSVAENITYSRLTPYVWAGLINRRRRDLAAREWMNRMSIKANSPGQPVDELSGGTQQKVALARVVHQDADVFLLDEPTRGIDVGTKAEIYRLIGELAAAGKAVIFVSSYLPELFAMCDTLGVMSRGRLVAIRPVKAWTVEEVMACAVASDAA